MYAFKRKPPTFAPAPDTWAGNGPCGRACFGRWVTNTMRGRCKIWLNYTRVGPAVRTRCLTGRRGCWVSVVCCRWSCPGRNPLKMAICGGSGIAGGASAMNSMIAFCRGRRGNFAACARRIILNAGWRWRRTGWRPATPSNNWNAGVPRTCRTPDCLIRCAKSWKCGATNFGPGIGRFARPGRRKPCRCWAVRG